MKKHESGFTLIELMVAVGIAAILLAIAAPNFSVMLKTNRVQSQVRELYSQLAYARSEAISRRLMVTFCASNDGATCSGNWNAGWIVCLDNNRDGACNAEPLLRKYSELGQNTLKVTDEDVPAGSVSGISFQSDGSTTQIKKLTFTICDATADTKYARSILKAGTGQLLLSSSDSTGIYKDVNGAELTCP